MSLTPTTETWGRALTSAIGLGLVLLVAGVSDSLLAIGGVGLMVVGTVAMLEVARL